MKTSELTGALLDYWVAEVEGMLRMAGGTVEDKLGGYSPSTKWAHGGPLIEKYRLDLQPFTATDGWNCETPQSDNFGDTPLQAICRAVVRAAFGDEVGEAAI